MAIVTSGVLFYHSGVEFGFEPPWQRNYTDTLKAESEFLNIIQRTLISLLSSYMSYV